MQSTIPGLVLDFYGLQEGRKTEISQFATNRPAKVEFACPGRADLLTFNKHAFSFSEYVVWDTQARLP